MPSQFYEIPLSPTPQVFSIALNGVTYRLTFLWRDAAMGGWMLDIADTADNPIACGIPLVTGANLLQQYEYLNLNGVMVIVSDGDPAAPPGYASLGVQSHLMWVSTP